MVVSRQLVGLGGFLPLLPIALLLALGSSVPSGSLLHYHVESSRWGHPAGSSLSPRSERGLLLHHTFLVFGRSLRDGVTLLGRVLSQISIGLKTLRASSLGFGA